MESEHEPEDYDHEGEPDDHDLIMNAQGKRDMSDENRQDIIDRLMGLAVYLSRL